MSTEFDRRRFLSATALAAAGTLLPAAETSEAAAAPAPSVSRGVPGPVTVEQVPSGVVMRNGNETVHITVCADDIIHVVAGPGKPSGASPHTPWLMQKFAPQSPTITRTAESVKISTPKMAVEISLHAGLLRFVDASGKPILQESARVPRRYTPAVVNGEKVYQVETRFFPDALEGFYGLGQHQSGVFDQRGAVIELAQENTNVAIPLLVSSLGYGLLWNTASKSYFDNRFATELSVSALAADAIDYYVLYGGSIDRVIQLYRGMTGKAPMFGRWAYGFVQSKDRYESARQLLDIAGEYRGPARAAGPDRAGLVLVEGAGRPGILRRLPEALARRPRRSAQAARGKGPRDDLRLGQV